MIRQSEYGMHAPATLLLGHSEDSKGTHDSVTSVAFSPDGTRIVSGSDDGTIRVWDASTSDTVAGPFGGFKGHTRSVTSVAFSPDGKRIVSGSVDQTIRVWDAHTGDTVAGPFKGHTNSVTSVAFSPDGTRIVSGSCDQTIRVWDPCTSDSVAENDISINASLLSHRLRSDIPSMDNFTFK
jgi:WD40 repeat protein